MAVVFLQRALVAGGLEVCAANRHDIVSTVRCSSYMTVRITNYTPGRPPAGGAAVVKNEPPPSSTGDPTSTLFPREILTGGVIDRFMFTHQGCRN